MNIFTSLICTFPNTQFMTTPHPASTLSTLKTSDNTNTWKNSTCSNLPLEAALPRLNMEDYG